MTETHSLIHLPPPPASGRWTAGRKRDVLEAIDAAINAGELTMETALVYYRSCMLTEAELDQWRRRLRDQNGNLNSLKTTWLQRLRRAPRAR